MKTHQKFTVLRLLVLGVLVAGFNARPASAQVLKGKFTLPSAIRWGQATLAAGNYSFALDKDYSGGVVTVLRGTQAVALIQSSIVNDIKSGRSEMVLENGNVRKLNLPQIGVSFNYPAQNPGHRAAPKQPQLAQIIPIAAVGVGR
ncbi:MAG: hypothetical protein ABSF45_24115 [Terriglobia bacterium]|jgi:hypothetical protein